ncbi:CRISPR-associated protein Cas5 [Streptomyces sp. NPDC006684]|uniref:CRISPR-associated protein Cas5 n=1 Tax=Streptomyces sp. NPDC006684 TaxID=3154477 RepID=UPI0034548A81
MPEALEVTVTATVVSFRNPLYAGLQIGLPCPPPSTAGGLLAAAAGGWDRVPASTRFAMAFHAAGNGVDLETYHPLAAPGIETNTTIKDRDFLALVTLTIWLTDQPDEPHAIPSGERSAAIDHWERALRRPAWPLRLGRSQDLVAVRTARVELAPGTGRQGYAIIPETQPGATGTRMRLTTAIAHQRDRTRWDGYRYHREGSQAPLADVLTTAEGQAVVLLPSTHPDQLATAA